MSKKTKKKKKKRKLLHWGRSGPSHHFSLRHESVTNSPQAPHKGWLSCLISLRPECPSDLLTNPALCLSLGTKSANLQNMYITKKRNKIIRKGNVWCKCAYKVAYSSWYKRWWMAESHLSVMGVCVCVWGGQPKNEFHKRKMGEKSQTERRGKCQKKAK